LEHRLDATLGVCVPAVSRSQVSLAIVT
jgi:hypothetical protein